MSGPAPRLHITYVAPDGRRADRDWVTDRWLHEWCGLTMVTHGRLHRLDELELLVARVGDPPVGAATFRIDSDACELVSLNAVEPGRGIGTALLGVVEDTARDRGAARVWLITTNDNPQALGFYQWHGYRLVAVHAGAVDAARALKPSIPKRGVNGVPLHDELELEKRL